MLRIIKGFVVVLVAAFLFLMLASTSAQAATGPSTKATFGCTYGYAPMTQGAKSSTCAKAPPTSEPSAKASLEPKDPDNDVPAPQGTVVISTEDMDLQTQIVDLQDQVNAQQFKIDKMSRDNKLIAVLGIVTILVSATAFLFAINKRRPETPKKDDASRYKLN